MYIPFLVMYIALNIVTALHFVIEEDFTMHTKNFSTAIYFSEYEINYLSQNNLWDFLEEQFQWILQRAPIKKIYLETHRSGHYVSKDDLLKMKALCHKYNLETVGGITLTTKITDYREGLFTTYCYSNPQHLEEIKAIVRYTSQLFDSYIIDDFFFTHCKCELCIEGKKDLSWMQYRTKLLKKVSKEIIIKESKSVNPNVQVIIKYPNWYEEYQQSGYNLEMGTTLFDGIYTGTETRDAAHTQQNLQRYSSYFTMRYLENTRPNGNMGGWFDTLDCSYNLNSVAEQAYLTLFSKAKEATIYSLGTVLLQDAIAIPLLGYVFEDMDQLMPQLGNPIGASTYKPFHSSGENYLHGTLGMLGIPFEPTPYFPFEASTLFLTASAACDKDIIHKLKMYMKENHTLILTSGFVKAMEDKGLEELIDIKVTNNKMSANQFGVGWYSCAYDQYCASGEFLSFPILEFATNDTQNTISALTHNKSYPILLQTHYHNSEVYVLNIPDEYGALEKLPQPVLDYIRKLFIKDFGLEINGPTPFSLFLYDNNTVILYNFTDHVGEYQISLNHDTDTLVDLDTQFFPSNSSNESEQTITLKINAHRFKVLKRISN